MGGKSEIHIGHELIAYPCRGTLPKSLVDGEAKNGPRKAALEVLRRSALLRTAAATVHTNELVNGDTRVQI
jgi:hypothetical protein